MDTQTTAQGLAALGRNGDSVLVHMTPSEVTGLQSIAQSRGTSLTVNPHTGLPEAFNLGGFFRSLAPTLAGIGANFLVPGSGLYAGIAAGALTGAALNKKDPLAGALMGGLSGYGGANLANSALGANLAKAGVNPTDPVALSNAATTQAAATPTNIGPNLAQTNIAPYSGYTGNTGEVGANLGFNQSTAASMPSLPYTDTNVGALQTTPVGQGGLAGGTPTSTDIAGPSTFTDRLNQAYNNVASDPMKFVSENKYALGLPLGAATLSGLAPEPYQMGDNPYDQYDPNRRLNLNRNTGLRLLADGGSVGGLYTNPDSDAVVSSMSPSSQGYGIGKLDNLAATRSQDNAKMGTYAEGGSLESGGFVVPADVVSHLGNGSSDAGLKILAKAYHARPIKGSGDGMSDDIPTTIDGKEPARVAHEEAYIPKTVVQQYGGPKAFYQLMDNVRKARTGSTKQGRRIDPEDFMV